MEAPITPINAILNLVLLIVGTVSWLHSISDLNTIMDFIMHCTGILSFLVFLLINWDKIKESFFKRFPWVKSIFRK
jgi:amino acid transporter